MVIIELFGVPRLRAGVAEVRVNAASLGEAFDALARKVPALTPHVVADGRLGKAYVVAVNGLQMTADPKTPLHDGDAVVLLSADAGG